MDVTASDRIASRDFAFAKVTTPSTGGGANFADMLFRSEQRADLPRPEPVPAAERAEPAPRDEPVSRADGSRAYDADRDEHTRPDDDYDYDRPATTEAGDSRDSVEDSSTDDTSASARDDESREEHAATDSDADEAEATDTDQTEPQLAETNEQSTQSADEPDQVLNDAEDLIETAEIEDTEIALADDISIEDGAPAQNGLTDTDAAETEALTETVSQAEVVAEDPMVSVEETATDGITESAMTAEGATAQAAAAQASNAQTTATDAVDEPGMGTRQQQTVQATGQTAQAPQQAGDQDAQNQGSQNGQNSGQNNGQAQGSAQSAANGQNQQGQSAQNPLASPDFRTAMAAAPTTAAGTTTTTTAPVAASGVDAMNGTSQALPGGIGSTAQNGQAAQTTQTQHAAQRGHGAQLVQDQVAVQIRNAAKDGMDHIRISLNPASLGRVDVQMEITSDGRLMAVIQADSKETYDLLRQDARSLERALQDAGFNTDSGSFTFEHREGGETSDGSSGGTGLADAEGDAPAVEEGKILTGAELAEHVGYAYGLNALGNIDIRI